MTDKFVRVPRISIGDDDEKTILENTEEHLGDEEIMYETLKVEETIYEESIYETPREYLDADETKVDVEEYLDDSTYPESEVPDSEYHKRGKTSIESEPSYKEDIPEKAKSTLEMEYLLKNTNPSSCESIFPKDDHETSDSVIEGFETTENKYQSRRLNAYAIEENEEYCFYQGKTKVRKRLDKKQEQTAINFNLNLELTNEEASWESHHNFFNSDEDSTQIHDFNIRKYFTALSEIDINSKVLSKEVNPEILESVYEIYKEFFHLIEKDIENNGFPLVFYQIVTPVIKEMLSPHLKNFQVIKAISDIDKTYEIPQLLKMVMDLAEIPEDITVDASTISNTIKIIDKCVEKSMLDNKEIINKKLVILITKNEKRLLKIIERDWNENGEPVNFIHFITNTYIREKNLIEKMVLKQLGNRKENEDSEQYQKSLKSSEKDKILMKIPSKIPTRIPSKIPTRIPSSNPSKIPTRIPSSNPSKIPTRIPSSNPSKIPTRIPSNIPTRIPSKIPTKIPSKIPTKII